MSNAVTQSIGRNMCLIGPPASGKDFYGKILSKLFGWRFVSASNVLRSEEESRQLMDTGSAKLLDDDMVCRVLHRHIENGEGSSSSVVLFDAFPRTPRQIEIMQNTWTSHQWVGRAISLDVPREVCRAKLLGRRSCPTCKSSWNIADVRIGNFLLPPILPDETHSKNICEKHDNNKECEEHWTRRKDDVPEIIDERLDTFYRETEPILQHFIERETLFKFSPYLGLKDMDRFQQELSTWLDQQGQREAKLK